MSSTSYLHSHQFLADHEKTQELIGRYVEILQNGGDAEAMYPNLAVHISICTDCRGMFEDLSAVANASDDGDLALRRGLIEGFAGIVPPRSPIAEPPLNLLFREAIILRVAHALPEDDEAERSEIPAAGFLLFYDTLTVGNLDLVALFTLHHDKQPGHYRIEGVIYPERPMLRFKASIRHGAGALDAHVENNRLVFSNLRLGPHTVRVIVTLEGYTRWSAG